ncbi:MAG TPA: DUF5011 domain-containing protein [Bacteroidales bacterium]|nr:DUF5011 domain-containing protein [Bacteroidales bacterium]
MKKIALIFASIVLIAGALTFTGCDKTNTVAPTVTLVGDATITTPLNAAFTDPGATATAEDGTVLTVTTTSTPAFNKDLAGTYTFTYSATDVDGNTGTATRTVIVENDAKAFAGTYNATDDGISGTWHFAWTETITVSSTVNNRIIFSRFAYYTGCTPYADMNASHTTINMPQQSFNCGSPAMMRTFTGSGAVTTTPMVITVNLTEVSDATYTGVDVFTKQ